MALTPEQIPDFVALTQNVVKRGKWTDLSLDLQSYVSATMMKKKVVEVGGPYIEFPVQTKNTDTARNVGMLTQDVTNIEDIATTGKIPWTKQTVNWSFTVEEEMFQSDRETIVKLLTMREHAAMNSAVELDEQNLWSAPTSTADKRPMGIPFWAQKDATTTPGGAFNGGNPSGFTSGCAEISSTTNPAWRNWTFGYANATQDDLIVKLKKAIAFTNFQPPVPHPELGFGADDYAMFTTYRVSEPLERLAESRNDNLKGDLARYVNAVTVAGIPIRWVPYLQENDTSDPIYGINWKVLRPYVKKGGYRKRYAPKEAPHQHGVYNVFIDTWMNWACYNRRALFVGSKS